MECNIKFKTRLHFVTYESAYNIYQVHREQVMNNTRNDKCAAELQRAEFLLPDLLLTIT